MLELPILASHICPPFHVVALHRALGLPPPLMSLVLAHPPLPRFTIALACELRVFCVTPLGLASLGPPCRGYTTFPSSPSPLSSPIPFQPNRPPGYGMRRIGRPSA
ncbi:hypothetical protein CGRA01v4_13128 [Colletotrichum graminicola]|nr:hypothetical protein CGRA01v4_13128 [Colletotrichum graminicola]